VKDEVEILLDLVAIPSVSSIRDPTVQEPMAGAAPESPLGYRTVAAKAGDIVELFGTGFGPTNPALPAGQLFSGAAPTTNPVTLRNNNVSVTVLFAGLSGAGLYQLNLIVPSGLGTATFRFRQWSAAYRLLQVL
jgi:uncharacterized protein (TIGR03437 family)